MEMGVAEQIESLLAENKKLRERISLLEKPVTSQVLRILIKEPLAFSTVSNVASRLCRSPTSLQENLRKEGTSLSALKAVERKKKLIDLLSRDPGVGIQRILYVADYTSPETLNRFIKNHFGDGGITMLRKQAREGALPKLLSDYELCSAERSSGKN